MNYENMTFTDGDKARLIESRNMICDWIMKNIVPTINDDDSLRVSFGGTYRCPVSRKTTERYHIVVYGERHNFYFMGNRGTGYIGYGEKFGGCWDPLEKVYSPYEIYPIVDNWKMIKARLLSMVAELKLVKKNIYTFEI